MSPPAPLPDATPPSFAELRSVLREASSWEELTRELSERSVSLESAKAGSLALRSGDSQLPWPSGVDPAELSRRFGEPYSAHLQREAARKDIAKGLEVLPRARSWSEAEQTLKAQGLELSSQSRAPTVISNGHAEPIPQDLLTQLEARWRHPFREWRDGLPARPDPTSLNRHFEEATSWRDLTSRLASERIQWDFDAATGKIVAFDEHARPVQLPAAPEVSTLESRFNETFRTTALEASRYEALEAAVNEARSWPDLAQRLRDLGLRMDIDQDHKGFQLVDRASQLPIQAGQRPLPVSPLSELEQRFGAFPAWAKSVASVEKAAQKVAETTELRERLENEHSRSASLTRDLQSRLSRHERLQNQLTDSQAAYRTHLAEAFRPAELPRVEAALEAHLGRHGYRATAEALQKRPQKFGRLLGRGGPFPNAQRREAQAAAQFAARRLRSLHELRLRLSALPEPPDQAAIDTARQTFERAAGHLHQLPSRQQMVSRVAHRLEAAGGLKAVGPALTPPAFRVASAAAALTGRAMIQQAER